MKTKEISKKINEIHSGLNRLMLKLSALQSRINREGIEKELPKK